MLISAILRVVYKSVLKSSEEIPWDSSPLSSLIRLERGLGWVRNSLEMTFDFLADNFDVHELYFHLLNYSAPIFHGNSAFVAQVALQKFDGNMDLVKYLVQTFSATMIKDFWQRVSLKEVNWVMDQWGDFCRYRYEMADQYEKWTPSHSAYVDFIRSYLASSEAISMSSLAASHMMIERLNYHSRDHYPNRLPREVDDHYENLKDQQVCRFLPMEIQSKFFKLYRESFSFHRQRLKEFETTNASRITDSVRRAIRNHMLTDGHDIPLYPKWFLHDRPSAMSFCMTSAHYVISHQDFMWDRPNLPDWVPFLPMGRKP